MANKYLKKLGLRIGHWVANSASPEMAIHAFAQLSRRLNVTTVSVAGDLGHFEGYPDDLVLQGYIRDKNYDPQLCLLIDRFLEGEAAVYIDVGANIGLTLVPIARRGRVKCYGFEPEPGNFALLQANVRANVPDAKVKLFNIALCEERSAFAFEISEDNRGDHRIRGTTLIDKEKFGESRRRTITVEGAPLDEIIDAERIAGRCVVKVDTQGGEVNVFRGGERVFARADLVVAEFCPYMLLRMGTSIEEYLDFMRHFPFGAAMSEAIDGEIALDPMEDVIAGLDRHVPFDGSAAKHLDVLMARQAVL